MAGCGTVRASRNSIETGRDNGFFSARLTPALRWTGKTRDCGKNHRLRQTGLGRTSIRYRKNNSKIVSGKKVQRNTFASFWIGLGLMVGSFFHTRALVMSLWSGILIWYPTPSSRKKGLIFLGHLYYIWIGKQPCSLMRQPRYCICISLL